MTSSDNPKQPQAVFLRPNTGQPFYLFVRNKFKDKLSVVVEITTGKRPSLALQPATRMSARSFMAAPISAGSAPP